MQEVDDSIIQDKIKTVLQRSKHDANEFAQLVLKEDIADFQEPCRLHHAFNDAFLNSGSNVALLYPRSAGKTTLGWLITPSWNVVFAKYKYCLFIGETQKKAEGTFRGLREIIRTNAFLKMFYTEIISDRLDEIVLRHINGEIIRFVCRGAGSSLRGLQEGGSRPDYIVCDDLVKTDDIYSDEMLSRLNDWFFSDVIPLGRNAHILSIGTYLTEKSLHVKLATNPPTGNAEKGVRPWNGFIFGLLNDDGTAIWPERYPLSYVQELKEQFRKQDKLATFYSEYMNVGVGAETRLFDLDKLNYYSTTQLDVIKGELKSIMIVDPAPSEGAKSKANGRDHNVLCVVGIDAEANYWVLDLLRSRERLGDVAESVIDMWTNHYPYDLQVEKLGGGVALVQTIEDKCRANGLRMRPQFIDTKITYAGKPGRIQALGVVIDSRKLYVPVNQPWVRLLEEEMLKYPGSLHDDILDAIAYAVQLVVRRASRTIPIEDLRGHSPSVF